MVSFQLIKLVKVSYSLVAKGAVGLEAYCILAQHVKDRANQSSFADLSFLYFLLGGQRVFQLLAGLPGFERDLCIIMEQL